MSDLRYILGIICVLAMLGSIVVPARADDDHPIDVRAKACTDADPSTHGTVRCLGEAEKAWDEELNSVYQRLMKELTPAHQDALRATQRAWIAHRDAEYELITAVHAQTEGTLCQIFHAGRRKELTRQRTLDLQGYLDWLRDFGKEPAS